MIPPQANFPAGQTGPGDSSTGRANGQERHSRFVEQMKLVLPALAAVFLSLLLLWPWMSDQISAFPLDILPFDYRSADTSTILNPRFVGSDRNDDPFVVTAKTATNLPDEGDWMVLDAPKAEITQQSGHWISLESQTGHVSRSQNLISLEDTVFLYRDDGVEFTTQEAVIDLGESRAFGSLPVTGSGPQFTVTADGGFAVENGGTLVRFLGKSHLVLNQTGSPSPKASAP